MNKKLFIHNKRNGFIAISSLGRIPLAWIEEFTNDSVAAIRHQQRTADSQTDLQRGHDDTYLSVYDSKVWI